MNAVNPIINDDINNRIRSAIDVLKYYLQGGYILSCAWSSGKDSASALNLVLAALVELKNEGVETAPVIVKHTDTLVENPIVVNNAKIEMNHIKAFAQQHGLPVRVEVVSPSLRQRWTVRTIGTGSLPSFPGAKRDCTSDWKASPMQRLDRQLQKEFGITKDRYLTITGVRFSESATRSANMRARGESALRPWSNNQGDFFLSPIADWDTSDVWEYLGLIRNGHLQGYSDLTSTFDTYEQAGGSSCAVVADMALNQTGKSKPCSARNGCFICVASGDQDSSMETMLEREDNAYMRGLNQLRQFLWSTRWDFNRREWIGRSIKHGYVRVMPDTYSIPMRQDLLRYCLTLQIEEQLAAEKAGIAPRFQIIGLDDLIAIDFEWSRLGGSRPFAALAIFEDIYLNGNRYTIPELDVVEKRPVPAARYFYVGNEWNDQDYTLWGIQDPLMDAFAGFCDDGRVVTLKNGQSIAGVMVEDTFTVDEESAGLVIEMELDYLLRTYHEAAITNPTEAARYYLRMGTVALGEKQLSHTDFMLRRTGWKHRMGLIGEHTDINQILDNTISKSMFDKISETHDIVNGKIKEPVPTLNEEQLDLFAYA